MAKQGNGDSKSTSEKGKRKPRKDTLRVVLLIDESGSMLEMAPAVIAGVDEFINDLKADPSETTRVLASLAMFDQRGGEPPVRVRFAEVPIAKVRPIGPSQYSPTAPRRSTTPSSRRSARSARPPGRATA